MSESFRDGPSYGVRTTHLLDDVFKDELRNRIKDAIKTLSESDVTNFSVFSAARDKKIDAHGYIFRYIIKYIKDNNYVGYVATRYLSPFSPFHGIYIERKSFDQGDNVTIVDKEDNDPIDNKIRRIANEAGVPTSRIDKASAAIIALLKKERTLLEELIHQLAGEAGVPASQIDETTGAIAALLDDAKRQTPTLARRILDEYRSERDWTIRSTEITPDLPKEAPALWSDRKKTDPETGRPLALAVDPQTGRSWKPPGFIRHYYGPWLREDGTGLTRPDLKRFDPQLYTALTNWLRTNELPADCPLPTKSEAITQAAMSRGLDPTGQERPGSGWAAREGKLERALRARRERDT